MYEIALRTSLATITFMSFYLLVVTLLMLSGLDNLPLALGVGLPIVAPILRFTIRYCKESETEE